MKITRKSQSLKNHKNQVMLVCYEFDVHRIDCTSSGRYWVFKYLDGWWIVIILQIIYNLEHSGPSITFLKGVNSRHKLKFLIDSWNCLKSHIEANSSTTELQRCRFYTWYHLDILLLGCNSRLSPASSNIYLQKMVRPGPIFVEINSLNFAKFHKLKSWKLSEEIFAKIGLGSHRINGKIYHRNFVCLHNRT